MAILALRSDRGRLRRLRQRLGWYREKIAEAKSAGLERIRGRLSMRQAAAKSDRALVLMKPIAWTFLPLCIGFIWVNDRFAAEPISPGSRFRVTALVEPSVMKASPSPTTPWPLNDCAYALELISARLVDKARAEHLVSIGLMGLVTVQILAWG